MKEPDPNLIKFGGVPSSKQGKSSTQGGYFFHDGVLLPEDTLWLFNIAMENNHF